MSLCSIMLMINAFGGIILQVPRKINVYTWHASLNRLPSRVNLANRGLALSSKACPLCDLKDETINHCLFSCYKEKTIWRKVWSWWRINMSSSLASLSIRDVACGNVGNVSIFGIPKLTKILHGVYQVVGFALVPEVSVMISFALP
nr:RNA-directed DNA polymerase, eukaryota, reverse transcriptase zinc-binding domain protein [Tanacetum cinerariifolium]